MLSQLELLQSFENYTALTCVACKANPPQAKQQPKPSPSAPAVVHDEESNQGESCHRGCPPDRDFWSLPTPAPSIPKKCEEMRTDAEIEQEFLWSEKTHKKEEAVLDLLKESFDGCLPGDWVTGIEIQNRTGVKAMNSCAARLRKKIEKFYDIDSRPVKGGEPGQWEYRICLREDSVRLMREREKEEEKCKQY